MKKLMPLSGCVPSPATGDDLHDGSGKERLVHLCRVVSDATDAVRRSSGAEQTFLSVCRIVCENGGIDYAHVAALDGRGAAHHLIGYGTASMCGLDNGGLLPPARRLLERACAQKEIIVYPHAAKSADDGPLDTPAQSVAVIPFSVEDRRYSLALYSAKHAYFDEVHVPLLHTLGGAISFALANFAQDEKRRAVEHRLQESEKRYRLLIQHYPNGAVTLFDRDLRYHIADGKGLSRLGLRPRECVGRFVHEVLTPELYRALETHHRRALEGRAGHATLTACGRHWEVQVLPVRDGNEAIVGGLMVAQDLTDKKRSEDHIRLTSEVFEGIADAVLIMDANFSTLFVNKAFTTITGYMSEEIVGKTAGLLNSVPSGDDVANALWNEVRITGSWQGELWDRRKNGEWYPALLKLTAVRDGDSRIVNYIGVFNDISQEKENQARLHHLAHHDLLTGLPNRSLLSSRAENAIAQAKRHGSQCALLFIDLDRFKRINDSLGHAVGDRLLKLVAERLQNVVRESDTVSRHGGDEFLVLLSEITHADHAGRVAEKIMNAVSEPYMIDGHELVTGASIGIAIYPDDGHDMGALLRNADAAMYSAKQLGGSRFDYYSAHMNTRAAERLRLEQDLRHAIERGQLSLVYQPQIQIGSRTIVGIEALLRWRHPSLGPVSPDRFISVAQDAGLILPIGDWVLREACRQRKQWANLSPDVPISVNVSPLQFRQANFVKRVIDILKEIDLHPTALELEVTESAVMHGAQEMIDKLTELNDHGVTLAIDDFGTGYSSLSYLRNLPIQRLKIDRSFVTDLPGNKDAAAITKAIVDMGHTLGLDVIAEGVETQAQADFLRDAACLSAQGFLYCHPLVADELELWLAKGVRPWTRLRVGERDQ